LAAPAAKPDLPALRELAFLLGRSHPAYTVLGNKLAPYHEDPYAWYIRVPDVPGLVRRLAPMLEARLAASVLHGYDGELMINFYRGGLRLGFAGGKLTAAEPWQASGDFEDEARAGCPGSVFTQLLFGYKSLAELRELYPDVWANEDAAVLLDILLPRHSSHLLLFSYT
jgi:hypothetical protein